MNFLFFIFSALHLSENTVVTQMEVTRIIADLNPENWSTEQTGCFLEILKINPRFQVFNQVKLC